MANYDYRNESWRNHIYRRKRDMITWMNCAMCSKLKHFLVRGWTFSWKFTSLSSLKDYILVPVSHKTCLHVESVLHGKSFSPKIWPNKFFKNYIGNISKHCISFPYQNEVHNKISITINTLFPLTTPDFLFSLWIPINWISMINGR